jgi:hypothetical protein
MTLEHRTYSKFADARAKACLSKLLESIENPGDYRSAMTSLGVLLGEHALSQLSSESPILVASTAEDADFLASGMINALTANSKSKIYSAVFWNNHYQLPSGAGSLAPIVHEYLEPGYKSSKTLVIVKSVMSGSCVVRTNLLHLLSSVDFDKIFVVSPVIHTRSIESLNKEFPKKVSKKFSYLYFAEDSAKDNSTGEVKPGIGGQIYKLLGLGAQPVQTSFIPQLVMSKFT